MDTITEAVLIAIKESCPPDLPEITDPDKSLLDYGVDSLDFSKVLLALEEKYEIRIPDEVMESLETVNKLAAYVREKMV